MSIDYFALAWKISFPGKPLKKLVLLALADHHNDEIGFAWPSYKTIATRTGISRRTVISLIAELEADGLVSRVERHKAGQLNTSNAYYLNEAQLKSAAAQSDTTGKGEAYSPSRANETSNGEVHAPLVQGMVIDAHHNGDQPAPSVVLDAHYNGDPRAPKLLSELLSEPLEEPLTTTAPPPAAESATIAEAAAPAAVAAPAADSTLQAQILRWIGFGDVLTPKERAVLDPPQLLAWAYWIHLEDAKPTRPKNAVALARSQWRKGLRSRDDLIALATAWLGLDDAGRRDVLDRVADAAMYGVDDLRLEDDYPGLPYDAAVAVCRAVAALGPPALTPPPAPKKPPPEPRPAVAAVAMAAPPSAADDQLWRRVLSLLEMQMTRATFSTWLAGTAARRDESGLVVTVRNEFAVDWLENRLHDLIQRSVDDAAGESLAVSYEVAT